MKGLSFPKREREREGTGKLGGRRFEARRRVLHYMCVHVGVVFMNCSWFIC